MTLRIVLAVALALAILGVALPGVEHARERRSARLVRGEAGAALDAGRSLLDRDEVVPAGVRGARRVVTVSIPQAGWDAAGVDYLALGGSPASGDPSTGLVAYRIDGHPERRLRTTVPVRASGTDPVVLRSPGDHRLVLALRPGDGERVVVVRHPS